MDKLNNGTNLEVFTNSALEELLSGKFKDVLNASDLKKDIEKQFKSTDAKSQKAVSQMIKNFDSEAASAADGLKKILGFADKLGISLNYKINDRGQLQLSTGSGGFNHKFDIASSRAGYNNGMPSTKSLSVQSGKNGTYFATSLEADIKKMANVLETAYIQRQNQQNVTKRDIEKKLKESFDKTLKPKNIPHTGHAAVTPEVQDSLYYGADSQGRQQFLRTNARIDDIINSTIKKITNDGKKTLKGNNKEVLDSNYISRAIQNFITTSQSRTMGRNTARSILQDRGFSDSVIKQIESEIGPFLDVSNTYNLSSDDAQNTLTLSMLGGRQNPLANYGRKGRHQQQGENYLRKIKNQSQLKRGIKNNIRNADLIGEYDFDSSSEQQYLFGRVTGDQFYDAYTKVKKRALDSAYKNLRSNKKYSKETDDQIMKRAQRSIDRQYGSFAPSLFDDSAIIRSDTASDINAERFRTTMIGQDAYNRLYKEAESKFLELENSTKSKKGKSKNNIYYKGKNYSLSQDAKSNFINDYIAHKSIGNLDIRDIINGSSQIESIYDDGSGSSLYSIRARQKVKADQQMFKGGTGGGNRNYYSTMSSKAFQSIAEEIFGKDIGSKIDAIQEQKGIKSDDMTSTLMNVIKENFNKSIDKQAYSKKIMTSPLGMAGLIKGFSEDYSTMMLNQTEDDLENYRKNGGNEALYKWMRDNGEISDLADLSKPYTLRDSLNVADVYDWKNRVKVGKRYRDSLSRLSSESGSSQLFLNDMFERLNARSGVYSKKISDAEHDANSIISSLTKFSPSTSKMSDGQIDKFIKNKSLNQDNDGGRYITIGKGKQYSINTEDVIEGYRKSPISYTHEGHLLKEDFDRTLEGRILAKREEAIDAYKKRQFPGRQDGSYTQQELEQIQKYGDSIQAIVDPGQNIGFSQNGKEYKARMLSLGSLRPNRSFDQNTGEYVYNQSSFASPLKSLMYAINYGDTAGISTYGADLITEMGHSAMHKKGAIKNAIDNVRVGHSKSFKPQSISPEEIMDLIAKNPDNPMIEKMISGAFISTKAGKSMLRDVSDYEHSMLPDGKLSLTKKGQSDYLNKLFTQLQGSSLYKGETFDEYFSGLNNFDKKQKKIVDDLEKVGKSEGLRSFTTREPLIDAQSAIASRLYFDDSITQDNVMRIGAGLAKTINADYDGDTVSSILKMHKNIDSINDDKTEDYQKNISKSIFEKMIKSEYKLIDGKYKLKDNLEISKQREKLDSALKFSDDRYFNELSGIAAKTNKPFIGTFSHWNTALRNSMLGTDYQSMRDKSGNLTYDSILKGGQGALSMAFGQLLEQDAISSKKVEKRIGDRYSEEVLKKQSEIAESGRTELTEEEIGSIRENITKETLNGYQSLVDGIKYRFHTDADVISEMKKMGIIGDEMDSLGLKHAVSRIQENAKSLDQKQQNKLFKSLFGDNYKETLETGNVSSSQMIKVLQSTASGITGRKINSASGFGGLFGGKYSIIRRASEYTPDSTNARSQILRDTDKRFLYNSKKSFEEIEEERKRKEELDKEEQNKQKNEDNKRSNEVNMSPNIIETQKPKTLSAFMDIIRSGKYDVSKMGNDYAEFANEVLDAGFSRGSRVTSLVGLTNPYGAGHTGLSNGVDYLMDNIVNPMNDIIKSYNDYIDPEKKKIKGLSKRNFDQRNAKFAKAMLDNFGIDNASFAIGENGELINSGLSFDKGFLADQLGINPEMYSDVAKNTLSTSRGNYIHALSAGDKFGAEKEISEVTAKLLLNGFDLNHINDKFKTYQHAAENIKTLNHRFGGEAVGYEIPMIGVEEDSGLINRGTMDSLHYSAGNGGAGVFTIGDIKTRGSTKAKASDVQQTLLYHKYLTDIQKDLRKERDKAQKIAKNANETFDENSFYDNYKTNFANAVSRIYGPDMAADGKTVKSIVESWGKISNKYLGYLADGAEIQTAINVIDEKTGAAQRYTVTPKMINQINKNEHLKNLIYKANNGEPLTPDENKQIQTFLTANTSEGGYEKGRETLETKEKARLENEESYTKSLQNQYNLEKQLQSLRMERVGKTGKEAQYLDSIISQTEGDLSQSIIGTNFVGSTVAKDSGADKPQELSADLDFSKLQSSQNTYNKALEEEYSLRKRLDGLQAKSANAVGDEAEAYKKISKYTQQQYKDAKNRTKIAEQGVDKKYAKQQRELQEANYVIQSGSGNPSAPKQIQQGGFWTNIGNTFKSGLKSMMMYGMVYGTIRKITSEIKRLIQITQQLDKSLTNIRIVTGMSAESANDLMISYNKLAKEIGTTTQAVAESGNAWMRQGYSVAEANDLIVASTKLSKLGMLDMESATKVLTSTLKGFKLEAEDAISIVDKLTKLDMNYATSAGEIGEAMSRTSAIAAQMGMSLDETAAMVTTIMDITQHSAQMSGTAVRTMLSRYGNVKASAFTDMQRDGEEIDLENINDIEKVMKALGIQIRSSKLEMRDFTEVLDELAIKWNTLSEVEQNAAATAFGGYRQRNQFQVLMTEWDQVKEATEIAANSAGTADEKYEDYLDSIEAKIQKLQAAWEGFVQNLNASPFLKTMYDGLTWMVEKFDKILNLVVSLLTALNAFKLPAAISSLGTILGGGFFGLKATSNIGMLGGAAAISGGATNNTKQLLATYLPRIASGVDRTANAVSGQNVSRQGLYANTANAFNNKQMLNKSIKNTGIAGKNTYYQTYTNEYGQRMTGTAKYTKKGWIFTDATGVKENAKDVLSPKAIKGLDNRRTTNNVLTAHKRGLSYALDDGSIAAYDKKTKSFNALTYDKNGNLVNRPLSKQEQQMLKSQKAQVTKMRVTTGIATGAVSGIMAGMSGTNSYFGNMIGGENVKINDIKSDTTDNIINGVATGAATGLLSAIPGVGPILGPILGPIIGDGIGGLFKWLRHKDDIDRKERVEEAKKNLEELNKVQSAIESAENSIFDMSTAEGVSKAKNDIDAIVNALLESNNREDILSKLGKTVEEIESVLLTGTEKEKREILSVINSENNSAIVLETFKAQEQDRYDAYKKYNDLASKEITATDSSIKDILEETGYYKSFNGYITSISGSTAADQAKNAASAIKELNEKASSDDITSAQKEFLDNEIERLQDIIDANNDYQAEILKMNKEVNKLEIKNAFSKADLDKWTSLDISSSSIEEVMQLFANNLELTGMIVRDSTGEITDYARVQIETFLRSNEKFSSLFSSSGKTLNQIVSGLNKQKDLLDQTKAASFEELKNAFDTQNKNSILTYLENMGYAVDDLTNELEDGTTEFTNTFETASNELMRLVYRYDDSQIEGIARALNMTTEDLLEMRKLLGGVKLSDLILTPEETRSSFDELNNIFSELSTSGTVTGENLEKLNTKYFSLYNNYDENGNVISTSFDNVLENLRKRLFGDQNTVGTQGFLYQNATFQTLKEDFGLYDSFYAQVKNNSDLYNMFNEDQKKLLESATSLADIMHLFNDEAFSDEMQDILIKILNDMEINNDYYKEIQDKLIEWQKHENNTIINNLRSQIDALNSINEERKKEIELIKAKEALENAKKEKVRVYRAGVGWTYEANQEKISDAKEDLEKLEREKSTENLQYQIDLLEQQNSMLDNISKNEELKGLKNSVDTYVSYMKNTFGKDVGSDITSLLHNSNSIMEWGEYVEMMGKQANASVLGEKDNILKNVNKIKTIDSEMASETNKNSSKYIGLQEERNKAVKSINESKQKLSNLGVNSDDLEDYLINNDVGEDYANIDNGETYSAQALNEQYYTMPERNKKGETLENSVTMKASELYSDSEINKALQALESGDEDLTVVPLNKDGTWGSRITSTRQLDDLENGSIVHFGADKSSENNDVSAYAIKDGVSWRKLVEPKKYGTFGLNSDILALINEVGTEGIVTPQGTITALPSKTGVIPADLTKNLYKLGEVAPNLIKNGSFDNKLVPILTNSKEDNSMNIDNFYATFETDDGFDFEKLLISARQYIKNTKKI